MKRNICCLGSAAIMLLWATTALAQRLPANVSPVHYDLSVTPDLQKATFAGTERIKVTMKAAARSITLNAAEIAFESVTITAAGQSQRASVTLAPARDQATFTAARAIPAGPADIEIHYRGILNDKLRGPVPEQGQQPPICGDPARGDGRAPDDSRRSTSRRSRRRSRLR